MSEADSPDSLAARLRVMRIITLSLVLGALSFLGYTLYSRDQGQPAPPPDLPLITYLALGLALIEGLLCQIVPELSLARVRREIIQGGGDCEPGPGAREDWHARYLTRLIMRLAFLEGATLFLIIAYLMEGQPVALAVAGLLLLVMALHFPSRAGVEAWVDRQCELIQQEWQRTQ